MRKKKEASTMADAPAQELKFRVLVPIWSRWHGAYAQPEEIITFPVLSPTPEGEENPHPTYPNLALAQELGLLEPYQEAQDGTNGADQTANPQ